MFRNSGEGRRYKTSSTKLWEQDVRYHLMDQKDECRKLEEEFNKGINLLEVSYRWYLPLEKSITKKGQMKKKIGDTDNFIKPIQDLIMGACNIDDCHIWRYKNILRIPNEEPGMWCGIDVIPISLVEHYSKYIK